jgi:transposase
MLKRHGKVFTVVVETTKTKTLMNEIARKIKPDRVVYSDTYHSYDALDVNEFHHHLINHSDVFVNTSLV